MVLFFDSHLIFLPNTSNNAYVWLLIYSVKS